MTLTRADAFGVIVIALFFAVLGIGVTLLTWPL